MEIPILREIVIVLGLAIVIILLFQRFKVPSILGFLLSGIIAGPYVLNLLRSHHEVEMLSEIGIILLLFLIGIEFSLKGLASIKKAVLVGGVTQVGLTILVTTVISIWVGLTLNEAIFLGFLFSLSSTAIVLKILQERGEVTSPHGKFSIALLIFQDIIVVAMMLFTPLLAGKEDNLMGAIAILLGKLVLVVFMIYLLGRFGVPFVLGVVVKTKNRELFILTIAVICFGIAWMTSAVGLSLALGAFFAGLIISESDYSHQATANVLPFREIFISFFFISVGTLLDLYFFISHFIMIVLLTLGVMIAKMFIVWFTVWTFKYPMRTVLLTALALFQVGEFSLLLSGIGLQNDIIQDDVYQYFLSVAILSMALTPFIMGAAPRLSDRMLKVPIPKAVKKGLTISRVNRRKEEPRHKEIHDHLVIIGYGINGQNIAKAANFANIPYLIIDLDPQQFILGKERNQPIIFGDASDELILHHARVHEARVVVIAISDPVATRKIISHIRMMTKAANLIVRTRYVKEIEENIKMGADEVIPEEFETSIEIFTRVLRKYLVPFNEIQDFIKKIRSSDYMMLTSVKAAREQLPFYNLHVPDREITSLIVKDINTDFVGKSIGESGVEKLYKINILTIKRGEEYITQISDDTVIKLDDLLIVMGDPVDINSFADLL
ncbi:MAG TPA: cation:proton antiporter [Saprospiraceae bacterium]|nr:cation:proton antiporter [Saprospiraceae bacterium]